MSIITIDDIYKSKDKCFISKYRFTFKDPYCNITSTFRIGVRLYPDIDNIAVFACDTIQHTQNFKFKILISQNLNFKLKNGQFCTDITLHAQYLSFLYEMDYIRTASNIRSGYDFVRKEVIAELQPSLLELLEPVELTNLKM